MDGGKCIIQLRGVRPFLSNKYDLMKHPNIRLTSDYDEANKFNVVRYLKRKRTGAKNLIIKDSDVVEVYELTEDSEDGE